MVYGVQIVTEREDEVAEKPQDEIQAWKAYYVSYPLYRGYLLNELNNNEEVAGLGSVVDSLTRIGMVKDDLAAVQQLYNVCFRWVKVLSEPIPFNSVAPSPDGAKDEPDVRDSGEGAQGNNIKHVLELKTRQNNWEPWLSLRSSSLEQGQIGIFAERNFAKNTALGFYMGEVVWQSDIEGGSKPSGAFLGTMDVAVAEYDLSYLDKDCKMRHVRPVPLGFSGGIAAPLYMGMHYIQTVYETHANHANAVIIEDGTIKSVKEIQPGAEIFSWYEVQ